jgi:hypothetical protein
MKTALKGLLVVICSAGPLGMAGGMAKAQSPLTYEDLVDKLSNLEALAKLPEPGEFCAQFSSYDRKSRYDQASDKFIAWDANGDGDGIIRKEGDQLVLAEMEGPGCIYRIWSADPRQGHVRIYLDGATKPAVDLPFRGYFDLKNQPFTRPALVHTVARGWNNYVPIPYQKSCKIVADAGWGLYFHFTYRTFPKGTKVPTFKRDLTAAESAALDRANNELMHRGPRSHCDVTGQELVSKDVEVRPGSAAVVANLSGPRAISCLKVRFEIPPAPTDRDLFRELALQIRWDGEQEPSVWSPLGDFFGSASANTYRSLPLGHTGDGWWYCNWFMPFARSAEVSIINDGKVKRAVEVEVAHVPLTQPAEGYGRFHTKWHRDAFLPSEPERKIDWPIVKTEGAGKFVGVVLHIWNPRGSWWGEGDEKFFVDGEKLPSTFGTGSEDYFGYAWCDPMLFENAYHNQTHNDGNNKGHVSVNRWHVADNIPFFKSFDGSIEKYYPNERPTLYAATAYWYLAPGGRDPYRPVPVAERVGYWQPVQTTKVAGAIEGERLKVLSKSAGNPHEQDLTAFGGQWSNDAHLWWIDARPGDKLELEIPVLKAGKQNLAMRFTKAPDYGIFQLYLDGQKLGEPLDLYDGSVIPVGPVSYGTQDLPAGSHTLRIEILGANEKAVKNYMFGLDYVKITPVQ